ncbi:TetR/AcrR family transcriptional regulator [Candidatus Palauibacter sp.]|uniref:TetR/AcrR family transcriptional regulator n=1 Tax=Candidatus Palauibacter sp. TaxID=3101350 RepID=UPI003AF2221C
MVAKSGAAPAALAGDPGMEATPKAGRAPEPPGTERRIFDAALEVFARKGRDGARLREIADRAAINRALLHYYFRTKEQLYEAVFAHGCRQFMAGLSQSLRAEQGFEDSLRAFVYGYIEYIYEHQDMARLMLNECLCGGGVLERHLTAAMEAREEVPGLLLEDRLRTAMAAGEIREVDLRHTLLTIVSACLFPFVALPTVRLFHSRAVEDFDRFLQERKAHIVDLLLGGLRPVPAREEARA